MGAVDTDSVDCCIKKNLRGRFMSRERGANDLFAVLKDGFNENT